MPLKNFDQFIKEPDGSHYNEIQPTGEFSANGTPLFLVLDGKAVKSNVKFGTIISNLLKVGLKDEKLSAHEVIENWNLMKNVAAGGNMQLTGKQIAYIEKLLLQSQVQKFIAGQMCEYLNAPEETPEKIQAAQEGSGGGRSD